MGICGAEPPAGSKGRQNPWLGVKSPLKPKTFELADTQRRGKSAKFYFGQEAELMLKLTPLFLPYSVFAARLKTPTPV